ncbi:MAG: carboxypeptidase M32 [Alphaproteobacteria bacterium]|nr:carboxypeptidase M32 [Alphaproteobacteria bacterium]
MNAYRQLEERFRRIGAIEQAISVLHWDTAAIMPEGGVAARAEQLSTLRLIAHQHLVAPEVEDLLAEAGASNGNLGEWQRANLREMRRRWLHAAAVPGELVEAESRACSECEAVWRRARLQDDFAAVLPGLERILHIEREIATVKGERLGTSPYEALAGQYEPGASVAAIDRLFDEIAAFLPDLIEDAVARQATAPSGNIYGAFPIEAQRRLAMRLMERIGFDFKHGRLDVSAHPFCGGIPDDVRITTRYSETDFARSLMGVLHETGHALYQRGLPAEWRLQPVGRARGMAMHESQSLLLEMQVCRSRAFLAYAAPIIREAFGGHGPEWEPDALYRRQIRVRRGLIRVDADEVTYPAHVILRYRLERAMLAGDLEPSELPAAWDSAMRDMLGVTPDNDREGCLQDIHWYDGNWGYFPTYTLGALIAAQLFEAARRDLPDLVREIAEGDFAGLIGWVRERVHSKGSLLSTAELVETATGRPLGTASFERHLRDRYLT